MDPGEQLVGTMRFPDEPSEASGQHAIDSLLGLGEETGAQQDNHTRSDGAQPAESLLAVHERH